MRTIRVGLYCDEIKEAPFVSLDGSADNWVYLGLLIVPEQDKASLVKSLLNARCGNLDHKQWGTSKNSLFSGFSSLQVSLIRSPLVDSPFASVALSSCGALFLLAIRPFRALRADYAS